MTDTHDLTTAERLRRRKRRSKISPSPLIHDRDAARVLLGGCSVSTLIRYERAGLLKAIKPSGSPSSKVFYSDVSLRQLIARLESQAD